MVRQPIRIGTRASALALVQAQAVQQALARAGVAVDLCPMTTAGDRMAEAKGRLEGQGWFTGELEAALMDGRVDLAVHSLKDVPTHFPPGLTLWALSRREDPADVFIPRKPGTAWAALGPKPRIGTASPRRAAWVKAARSDATVIPVRGNLATRLAKLEAEGWDGLILAAAGIRRLGLWDRVGERFDPVTWVPAPGQGIVAVEGRADDEELGELLRQVFHDSAMEPVAVAERAVLAALGGGCALPLGAYAYYHDGVLVLVGALATPAGALRRTEARLSPGETPEALGARVACRLAGVEATGRV
ncbi:MAG: hydroxymethylbilane synthase [Firmicutes bacterium]|nr:hydroxymethylbilane synthase [Alicyclobacillaceae bacterium]MCL6497597.1 hydroxymethylbilane synthase [Bacillota bacterium]